jgi:hypothetical protein
MPKGEKMKSGRKLREKRCKGERMERGRRGENGKKEMQEECKNADFGLRGSQKKK